MKYLVIVVAFIFGFSVCFINDNFFKEPKEIYQKQISEIMTSEELSFIQKNGQEVGSIKSNEVDIFFLDESWIIPTNKKIYIVIRELSITPKGVQSEEGVTVKMLTQKMGNYYYAKIKTKFKRPVYLFFQESPVVSRYYPASSPKEKTQNK